MSKKAHSCLFGLLAKKERKSITKLSKVYWPSSRTFASPGAAIDAINMVDRWNHHIIVTRIIIIINMVDRLIIINVVMMIIITIINMVNKLIILIVLMMIIITITTIMKNYQAKDDLECRPGLLLLHHSSWWGYPGHTGKPCVQSPCLFNLLLESPYSFVRWSPFFTPYNSHAHPSSSCVSACWPCLRPLVGDQRARR